MFRLLRLLRLFACASTAAIAFVGCLPVSFLPDGPVLPPRGPGCSFRLLATPPASPFTELGVAWLANGGVRWSGDLADLRKAIAPLVCQAGGDAAIALPTGNDFPPLYNRATVIRLNAEATRPTRPSNDGCRYDTQCKGERLCKEGACVDP